MEKNVCCAIVCRRLVKNMRDRLKAESNKPPNASLCSRIDCVET